MSSYIVTGDSTDHIRSEINLHLQDIADRLDKQEGVRDVFRRVYSLDVLQVNDKSPYVGDGDIFYTDNTDNVTIVNFLGGWNGRRIWILFRDNNTTLDFRNGNLRERDSNLISWTATKSQIINAFYADGLWYCGIWDFEVTNDDGTVAGGGSSNRWQFVDITGDYTVTADDVGKIIRSNIADAHTVTMPDAIIENGQQVVFYQKGAGQMTLAGSGFTINTPTTLVMNEQYGTITLIAESSTEGFIAGRMSN